MPIIGTQQSPIRIDTDRTIQAVFPPNYFAIRYGKGERAGEFENHNFVFAAGERQPIT